MILRVSVQAFTLLHVLGLPLPDIDTRLARSKLPLHRAAPRSSKRVFWIA